MQPVSIREMVPSPTATRITGRGDPALTCWASYISSLRDCCDNLPQPVFARKTFTTEGTELHRRTPTRNTTNERREEIRFLFAWTLPSSGVFLLPVPVETSGFNPSDGCGARRRPGRCNPCLPGAECPWHGHWLRIRLRAVGPSGWFRRE